MPLAKRQSSSKSAADKRDIARAKKDAAREKAYRKRLTQLERTGLYQPKAQTLTPYRKRRVNALVREFGPLLNTDLTFFLKAPAKARKGAKEAGFTTTRKGIFVEREREKGHILERAKLVKRRARDRYDIVADRPIEKSKLGRERETYILPLAGGDTLAKSRASLEELVSGYPRPGRDRRYRFTISDAQGSFMSRRAFTSIEELWEYALQYRKTKTDQIAFLDKLEIVIVKRGDGRKRFDPDYDIIVDELGPFTTDLDPDLIDEDQEAEWRYIVEAKATKGAKWRRVFGPATLEDCEEWQEENEENYHAARIRAV